MTKLLSTIVFLSIASLSLGVIGTNQAFAGGEMMPIDTTALLVAGTTFTASWMVPIVVAAAGIGLLIQSQKTRLKHNSCPSCHLETDDIFKLGGKKVGKCQNPKCRVSLFFAE